MTSWTLGRPKKSAAKNVLKGSPADIIINEHCDGLATVNRFTGIAPSTIQSWLKAGKIPPKRHAAISALASQLGKPFPISLYGNAVGDE